MNLENIEDIYNLSPLQEGVLFQSLFEEHPWVYFQQLDLTLQGRLDVDCFAEAWQRVMDRTTALRTSFEWQNLETPLQIVHRKLEVPFRYEDWRRLAAPAQQRQISEYVEADRKRGFALTDPPLIRLLVVRMTDSAYRCLISYHHILLDGWSLAIVLGEVFSGYELLVRGRDLEFQPRRPYRDYIAWLQSQDKTRAQHFWTQDLQGFIFPTTLPLERSAAAQKETGKPFTSEQVTLSPEVTSELQKLGRRYQITLNTIVQGAWALLLSLHSGEPDVVYGSTVSGRSSELPGIESMVGLLINTLPVRATIVAQQSLASWLADFQLRLAELTQFEYSALVEIQKCSDVPAGLPLFESLVVFENYPLPEAPFQHEEALRISKFNFFEQGNYPLTISVGNAASLVLRVTYDRGRFNSTTIKQLLRRFESVFTTLLAHADVSLKDINVLSESERQQMLVEWNDTRARAQSSYVIPDLFEEQVRERGDAIALVSGDLCLTYDFVNQQANLLAHLLLSLQLQPDRPLGVFFERSPLQVICLLAILKAGAPYLALDHSLPARRLALLIKLSDLRLIIAEETLAHLVPPGRTQVLCPRLALPALGVVANPVRELHPDQLAYVSYTSGSTGTPKAVAVRQRAVVRLVLQSEYVSLGAEQRLLHAAPLSFDASTFELWGGLLHGGTVVLLGERVPQAAVLGALIREQQVRTMWLTASLFNAVVDEDVQQLEGLEQLVIGGEALSAAHVERVLAAFPRLRLVNGYGPTEATTFACTYELSGKGESRAGIAIGRPIAETEAYVLGAGQQLVPVGVIGELYLGGEGLARGYSNSSELTAEKFVPHGYSEQGGARLYRTGDLVRYRADGALEYVGRVDHQVKVRGFRIELGEIEAALRGYPEVAEAVVVVQGGSATEPGKRLLAYVVTEREPNVSQYQQYLRERLPEYMIP
ncbi:MAG TPA: amino acid adenylation domain-containing protein, partial [Pyrinomonadaceae bacterium]